MMRMVLKVLVHQLMYKETRMVFQHTINTKRGPIKLKVERLQLLQPTLHLVILILHRKYKEVLALWQNLEVMVSSS